MPITGACTCGFSQSERCDKTHKVVNKVKEKIVQNVLEFVQNHDVWSDEDIIAVIKETK
jgi:hypothetical protein